jgi:hypothetical protein
VDSHAQHRTCATRCGDLVHDWLRSLVTVWNSTSEQHPSARLVIRLQFVQQVATPTFCCHLVRRGSALLLRPPFAPISKCSAQRYAWTLWDRVGSIFGSLARIPNPVARHWLDEKGAIFSLASPGSRLLAGVWPAPHPGSRGLCRAGAAARTRSRGGTGLPRKWRRSMSRQARCAAAGSTVAAAVTPLHVLRRSQ